MAKRKGFKQTRSKEIKTKPNTERKKETPFSPTIVSIALTCLFAVVGFIGILNHEMWRDEYQAWLIARDAHSFIELFQNLKYEGHPSLLYLLLYGVTSISTNPFAFQIFSLLVGIGFVFTVTRYAPFTLLEKTLFVFGYFTLFEYTIIARGYGLGILFLFLVATFWKNRHQKLLIIAVFLALMANTSVFGLILALAIGGVLVVEMIIYKQITNANKKQFTGFLLIGVIGVILSILVIMPEENNSYPSEFTSNLSDGDRWSYAVSRIFDAYFAIPDVSQLSFWNTNFFTKADFTKYNFIVLVVLLISFAGFLRKRMAALLFFTGTIGILLFHYFFYISYARYLGHFFMFYVFCFWVANEYELSTIGKNQKLLNTANKLLKITFIAMLGINAIGGILAWKKDFKETFSSSLAAGKFLEQQQLDSKPIIGASDYLMLNLTAIMKNKIYYPERDEYCSFIIWDEKRKQELNFPDIINAVKKVYKKNGDAILILSQQPKYNNGQQELGLENGPLTDSLQVNLLAAFPPQIIKDEEYYIYRVSKITPPNE